MEGRLKTAPSLRVLRENVDELAEVALQRSNDERRRRHNSRRDATFKWYEHAMHSPFEGDDIPPPPLSDSDSSIVEEADLHCDMEGRLLAQVMQRETDVQRHHHLLVGVQAISADEKKRERKAIGEAIAILQLEVQQRKLRVRAIEKKLSSITREMMNLAQSSDYCQPHAHVNSFLHGDEIVGDAEHPHAISAKQMMLLMGRDDQSKRPKGTYRVHTHRSPGYTEWRNEVVSLPEATRASRTFTKSQRSEKLVCGALL